ncbi:helix-turn-helix domain-containing protein [Streptomyces sp. NPDC093093]|uniref:helix-turn-helix domain-containing protein n=1 Tax=Streptomyces sp. NPDC093093 TaxID=3366025 RepID=UPI003812F5D9
MPHLTERGITLSSSQVHRLVSGTPERLSLPVLATLCDILDCTPAELIATSAQNLPARRAAGEEAPIAVSLQVHLREFGVPPQRGRTSAIRQLVLQAPASVIAKALGYHDKTATRLLTEAGGTWSRYALGDHSL